MPEGIPVPYYIGAGELKMYQLPGIRGCGRYEYPRMVTLLSLCGALSGGLICPNFCS